jgi:hypothetical protein
MDINELIRFLHRISCWIPQNNPIQSELKQVIANLKSQRGWQKHSITIPYSYYLIFQRLRGVYIMGLFKQKQTHKSGTVKQTKKTNKKTGTTKTIFERFKPKPKKTRK